MERIGGVHAKVSLDTANRKVHFRQTPGGRIRFLPEDGHGSALAAVLGNELLALHEHTAGAAAGVVNPPRIRLDHLNENAHDTAGSVELPALLAFTTCKLAKEVFVHTAKNVFAPVFCIAKPDSADKVY